MATSRLVLLLIQVTVTQKHTHMLDIWSWVTDASSRHIHTVWESSMCVQTYINAGGFCIATLQPGILDTLLQLASLHIQHTCTLAHSHTHISLIPVSLLLSLFLSTMKSLCTSARCSKQIWLQRSAPHRGSWHTGRGSKTHRQQGQDTKHQHHPNPLLLKGSKSSHPLQKYHP